MGKVTDVVYLIDVVITLANNILKKHVEKIVKYTPLVIEIKELLHIKYAKEIPVIIVTTEEIPKSLHTSIKNFELSQNLYTDAKSHHPDKMPPL